MQRPSATRELDIKQVLDTIRQEAALEESRVAVADARPALQQSGVDADARAADDSMTQGQTMAIGRGGVAPLILGDGASAQAALEAYRLLRTRLMNAQAKARLRSIVFTSSVPSEGKTLTVMNLGLCYAQLPEQRVLIVDADLRTRGLSRVLGHEASKGLGEVLGGQIRAEDAIVSTDRENLFALPGGSISTPPPELFTGPKWQEFVDWAAASFKILLIDTPPILALADFELISAVCDGVVLLVRAGGVDRETLQQARATVDSSKLIGVILNGVDRNTRGYHDYGYADGATEQIRRA